MWGMSACSNSSPTAASRPRRWRCCAPVTSTAPGGCRRNAPDGGDAAALAADIRMELIAAEREFIYKLLQDGEITDEARRRIERELDLEEASIACKKEGGEEPPL